jgi:hypothetical protein
MSGKRAEHDGDRLRLSLPLDAPHDEERDGALRGDPDAEVTEVLRGVPDPEPLALGRQQVAAGLEERLQELVGELRSHGAAGLWFGHRFRWPGQLADAEILDPGQRWANGRAMSTDVACYLLARRKTL